MSRTALATLMALGLIACESKKPQATNTAAQTAAQTTGAKKEAPKDPRATAREHAALFGALPESFDKKDSPASDDMITLGRTLYYESRLSKNHDLSCNSCHGLDTFGVDNKPTSTGHKGQLGTRNSPTVYNAAGHTTQFWDGRAADVEAQAKGPILNPVEMAVKDEAAAVATLKSIPGYINLFKKAFPKDEDPITYDNMAAAIGAFERRLVTPAPWDKYLGGDDKALTDQQIAGLNTFVEVGCTACHSGVLVGGGAFQKLGAVKPWPNLKDQGVFEVSKKDEDKMMFKPPSLRNIAKTGPYFHDGATAKLPDAIKMMGAHQLGRDLTDQQVADIAAWLDALTGEIPADYIKKPELPASGPNTPKPDPS